MSELSESGRRAITHYVYSVEHKKTGRLELLAAAACGITAVKGIGFLPSDLTAATGFLMGGRSINSFKHAQEESKAGRAAMMQALAEEAVQYNEVPAGQEQPEQVSEQ